jgi:hypothetical protein
LPANNRIEVIVMANNRSALFICVYLSIIQAFCATKWRNTAEKQLKNETKIHIPIPTLDARIGRCM